MPLSVKKIKLSWACRFCAAHGSVVVKQYDSAKLRRKLIIYAHDHVSPECLRMDGTALMNQRKVYGG